MSIRRGEIYFVELGPTRGREIDKKRRPVVVVSVNWINSKPLVVCVVPGSTWKENSPIYSNLVLVEPSENNGLSAPTVFQCHQIRALDHGRFDAESVGVVAELKLVEIEKAIKRCLGL